MEHTGPAQIQTMQKLLHAMPEADERTLDALDRMTRRRASNDQPVGQVGQSAGRLSPEATPTGTVRICQVAP